MSLCDSLSTLTFKKQTCVADVDMTRREEYAFKDVSSLRLGWVVLGSRWSWLRKQHLWGEWRHDHRMDERNFGVLH